VSCPFPSSWKLREFFLYIQRSACHIQVFALSRWLAVTLPIEYYEFAKGLQWSIPYFILPWETGGIHPIMVKSNSFSILNSYISKTHDISQNMQLEGKSGNKSSPVFGLPLAPMEYISFFEVRNHFPDTCFQFQIAVIIYDRFHYLYAESKF